jgi:hypothetical protein
MPMKKFKFEKPFASFEQSHKHAMLPLKERWRIALHDPAYIFIFGGILLFTIGWVIL